MQEPVEAGAGRPEGQRVVLSSRTRKGGAGRRGRRGPGDPRQSRNCLCSGTGGSAEAAPGAGHVRRRRRSWRGSRAGTGPGGSGAGRRLSQPRVERAESGRNERAAPRARGEGGGRHGGAGALGARRCAARAEWRIAGGGAGGITEAPPSPQAEVVKARPTRRPCGRLNRENGGAALVIAGLVFAFHANPGTAGTAIPACVPGAPHYAWGKLHPAWRRRAGIGRGGRPR